MKSSVKNYNGLLEKYSRDWKMVEEKGREYYEELLKENNNLDLSHLLEVIPNVINEIDNFELTRCPDEAEILRTIKEMKQDSAPSPDDFGANFYTYAWDIIGSDLCGAIMEFFRMDTLPNSWKATFLTLIPKKEILTQFSEFRPINLCNVRYKVISKLLNNRLRGILPRIISKEQGAFVKGRLI